MIKALDKQGAESCTNMASRLVVFPFKQFSRLFSTAVCLAAALACTPGFATEYRIGAGDALSLRFIGANTMQFDIPIEADGSGWFPVVGALSLSGLTLEAPRARISDACSTTTTSLVSNRAETLLDHGQIFVNVARYRPVYVERTAGPSIVIDYRPGLTLRQVIASARAQVPHWEGRTLSVRNTTIWQEMTQAKARIWRLRAQLGELDPDSFVETFANSAPDLHRLAVMERETLRALDTERDTALGALSESIARAETRLSALVEQLGHEEEVRQQDDRLVANISELSERGLAPTARIADARRAAREAQADAASAAADTRKIRITRDTGEVIEATPDDMSVAVLPGDVIDLLGQTSLLIDLENSEDRF